MNHVQIVEQENQRRLEAAKQKDAAAAQIGKIAKKFDPNIVSFPTYKGHLLIAFGSQCDGDRPFSFGSAKASAIIDAVEKYGVEAVLDAIRAIAGR